MFSLLGCGCRTTRPKKALEGVAAAASQGAAVSDGLISQVQNMGQVTGSSLLELANTLPFIAPVAYLVGAIASSAVTAVRLREDCLEFGKVVQMLEGILLKAESLEGHEAIVDDVRCALEEALELMESIQRRGHLASTLCSKSDKNEFEDIKERIQKAINRLNLSATVEVAAISSARFKQSESVRKLVEEMGGVENVMTNPELEAKILKEMETSDRLVHENIKQSRKELRAVGDDVRSMNSVVDQMHNAQKESLLKAAQCMSLQTSTDSKVDTVSSQMEGMTQEFMRLQKEAEVQKLQNAMLQDQVRELRSMLSEVKDCMTKFPVSPVEPQRMAVVESGQFMNVKASDELAVIIQGICKEASQKWSLPSFFNIIGAKKQFTAGGYMPELLIKEEGATIEEGELAVNMCGLGLPRKMSICQHVIAKQKPVTFDGLQDQNAPKFASPEELECAAKVDPEVLQFLETMKKGGGDPDEGAGDAKKQEVMQVVMSLFQRCMSSGTLFYSGVPIVVDGQVTGSMCLMGPGKPKNWDDTSVHELESLAKRASNFMEKQLNEKRRAAANQAMMAQMMQMQQQMFMQMQQQQGQAGFGLPQ